MDEGLKDFIQELREYGNARKGDLAGMILEAANRLEFMDMRLRMADRWITDREPTDVECYLAGETGFILCISGTDDDCVYDHAIEMTDNYYEDGKWYIRGVGKTDGITVHGWMLPPVWEE